jgi:hypothetical protein
VRVVCSSGVRAGRTGSDSTRIADGCGAAASSARTSTGIFARAPLSVAQSRSIVCSAVLERAPTWK